MGNALLKGLCEQLLDHCPGEKGLLLFIGQILETMQILIDQGIGEMGGE